MLPPQRPAQGSPLRAALISVFLVAVTAVAYGGTCSNGFTEFDDGEYVTHNAQLKAGLSGRGLWWALTTTDCANWHPLTWLSLQLDYEFYGLAPDGYHLTSLAIHVANTLLLFWLLRAATGADWRAAVVAALFAVHPLHVESVAWVAERKDVLSAFFWLLTLRAYLGYVRRPGPARYLLVLLAFALGLMAKPMVVTLPFVLLLLDYWPLNRLTGPSKFEISNLKYPVLEKVPLFGLSLASCLVTLWAQRPAIRGAASQMEDLTPAVRIMNAAVAYARYMGQAVWPARLAAFYPHPGAGLPAAHAAGAGLLLATITALVIWAGRRRPYLPVGWFWYLGTLVPVIGLVQVGFQVMADRYTYLPLVGLFVMLVWGTADLAAPSRVGRVVAGGAAALVLTACVFCTRAHVGCWRDNATLWEHALEVTEDNWMAQYNLGVIRAGEKRDGEARRLLTAAARSYPNYAEAHNNLGVVLTRQPGQLKEAEEELRTALRLKPGKPEHHCNLGVCLAKRGKTEEAVEEFREALRIRPGYADAHFNLGLCLLRQGKGEEAESHFRAAQGITPGLGPPDTSPGH
jgi:hypothetical protein